MIVKMTTAGTDQTTWEDVSYNISTGQYQSSSGLLRQNTNLQKYVCSKTMSGSYIYDVVWRDLEIIENKQNKTKIYYI